MWRTKQECYTVHTAHCRPNGRSEVLTEGMSRYGSLKGGAAKPYSPVFRFHADIDVVLDRYKTRNTMIILVYIDLPGAEVWALA